MKKTFIFAFLFTLVLAFASSAHAAGGPSPDTAPQVPSPLNPDILGPIDPFPPPTIWESF